MANADWMVNIDNIKPTNSNVDYWFNQLKSRATEASNAIQAPDFSRALTNSDVDEADRLAKQDYANRKAAYKSQYGVNAEAHEYKDIQKKIKDATDKFGLNLANLAYSSDYANDEFAKEYRNNPNFKKEYDNLLKQAVVDQASEDAARDAKLYGGNEYYSPEVADQIQKHPFLTGVKDIARGLANGVVGTLGNIALAPQAAYENWYKQRDFIDNGTELKAAKIQAKEDEIAKIQQEFNDAKATGDMDRAAFLASVLGSPDMQLSEEDTQFKNSQEYADYTRTKNASKDIAEAGQKLNSVFGTNAYAARKQAIQAASGVADLEPSSLGTEFLHDVTSEFSDPAGLVSEIMTSIPLSLISASPLGIGTALSGAFQTMQDLWAKNEANPDALSKLTVHKFDLAYAYALAGAVSDWCGDTIIGNTGRRILRSGSRAFNDKLRQTANEVVNTVETRFAYLPRSEQQKLIHNMMAIKSQDIANDFIKTSDSGGKVADIVQKAQEDTAAINGNLLQAATGGTIGALNTIKDTTRNIASTVTDKLNNLNRKLSANPTVDTATSSMSNILTELANGTGRFAKVTKLAAPLSKPATFAGKIGKELIKEGLGEAVSNLGAEYYNKKAEATYESDKSKEMTEKEGVKAAAEGFAQGIAMGGSMMAGTGSIHGIKSLIHSHKLDVTNDRVFNNVYKSLDEASKDADQSAAIGDTVTTLNKELDASNTKARKGIEDAYSALSAQSNLAGSIQTIDSDIIPGLKIIDVNSKDNINLIANADKATQKVYKKAVQEQQDLLKILKSNKDKKDKLATIQDNILEHTVASIRGLEGSDRVAEMHATNFIKRYDLTKSGEEQIELQRKFEEKYAKSLMNDKSISQDDAEAIAHSRFTEYTNDQKDNNAYIDEAIEKTPQDLIGKDAYNLVSSIVDKKFNNNSNLSGNKDSYKKYRLGRIANVLQSHALDDAYITRLNSYDSAGDKFLKALAHKDSGNYKKAKQAFSEFADAMKKNNKTKELEYLSDVYNNASEDFTEYSGKYSKGFRDSFIDKATGKSANKGNKLRTYYSQAMDSRGSDIVINAMAKAVNSSTRGLDEDEYQDLVTKGKSGTLSVEDLENLKSNAYLRGDQAGLEIVYRQQNLSMDKIQQDYQDVQKRISPIFNALMSSEAVLKEISNDKVKELSASGSEGKKRLQDSLKQNHLDAVFTIQDITPEEQDETKKVYGIVPVNYASFAPIFQFVSQIRSIKGAVNPAATDLTNNNIYTAFGSLAQYYLDHKKELSGRHTFSRSQNDFDYIVQNILMHNPILVGVTPAFPKNTSTDDFLKGISTICKYMANDLATVAKYGPMLTSGTPQNQFERNLKVLYIVFKTNLTSNFILNSANKTFSTFVAKYIEGIDDIIDALNIGQQKRNIINNRNIRSTAKAMRIAGAANARTTVRKIKGLLMQYRSAKEEEEAKNKKNFNKSVETISSKIGESDTEVLEDSQKLMESKDPQDHDRAVKVVENIVQGINNVSSSILYEIANHTNIISATNDINDYLSRITVSRSFVNDYLPQLVRKCEFTITQNTERLKQSTDNKFTDQIQQTINRTRDDLRIISGLLVYFQDPQHAAQVVNEPDTTHKAFENAIYNAGSNKNKAEFKIQVDGRINTLKEDEIQTNISDVNIPNRPNQVNFLSIKAALMSRASGTRLTDKHVYDDDLSAADSQDLIAEISNARHIADRYADDIAGFLQTIGNNNVTRFILNDIFKDAKNNNKYNASGHNFNTWLTELLRYTTDDNGQHIYSDNFNQVIIDNFNTIVAKINKLSPVGNDTADHFYDGLARALLHNNATIQQVRDAFQTFNFTIFGDDNANLIPIFANEPVCKKAIENSQYPNQLKHFINVITQLDHIQWSANQVVDGLRHNIHHVQQLDDVVNHIVDTNNRRYFNGSEETRNQIITTEVGHQLNNNELAYVRNNINQVRAINTYNNIMQHAQAANNQDIKTRYIDGGEVNEQLRNGIDVINSIQPADALNNTITIDPDNLIRTQSTESIYKTIINIATNWTNRIQGLPDEHNLITQFKKQIKDQGFTDDNIIDHIIDDSATATQARPDFIKRNLTGVEESNKFIKAFFNAVDKFNSSPNVNGNNQIFTVRTAETEDVAANRSFSANNNHQSVVRFNNNNNFGGVIYNYFINRANLSGKLRLDGHKFNRAFLHCSTASDITNALLATDADWANDFASFSKNTEELTRKFGRVVNDTYIHSKYGNGDFVDQLFVDHNGTKVGIETLQAVGIQAAINATFNAGKLEAGQDTEQLDKFTNLDAVARSRLLTLKGVNRDELLDTITTDMKKLLPFAKTAEAEQLAEGMAVRALQLLQAEGYIKFQFVNIHTGEVHESESGMSNQNCMCLVTYNDEAKYNQMKAEVNKINKWNLTDHVNYFEQVYGARPITNLESVDQHHYDQNQMEWSNQAAVELYDIASYLDNQGRVNTNVPDNDTRFDDFVDTYKNDFNRSYVYNSVLNEIRHRYDEIHRQDNNLTPEQIRQRLDVGTILNDLYIGGTVTGNVDYFNRNNGFHFDAAQFRRSMDRICYLAIGAYGTHKADVGIINRNYVSAESRAIFGDNNNHHINNPFVFIDGKNLYSEPKSGIFAPDENILSIGVLNSKVSAFNVYSGLDVLHKMLNAGITLHQITNNDADGILIKIYDDVDNLRRNNWQNVNNSPSYTLYKFLGLKDIQGVGDFAEAVRNDVKTAISDKLKEINFLLGISLRNNRHNTQTFRQYITQRGTTALDQVNKLVEAYHHGHNISDTVGFQTTLDNQSVELTQWQLTHFYHRVTPNNRLYTCGSLVSDRETKGNRCTWCSANGLLANGHIDFTSALDQNRLSNLFNLRTRAGNNDNEAAGIANLMNIFAANLGLSTDKVFRMNYWKNTDTDSQDWSLATGLKSVLDDQEFTDAIKYASDNGHLEYNSDGTVKLDGILDKYKVATVDATNQTTNKINDNKFYKKFSFTEGDWTKTANSIPILNNLIEMYENNHNIFHEMADIINKIQEVANSYPDNHNDTYVTFRNSDLNDIRSYIATNHRTAFNNINFRFVHEGDGLTSGPGLSNGQFNDITAFELLRNTDSDDPRYNLFNMTGVKIREFFDILKSRGALTNDIDHALDIYLATGKDASLAFHTFFRTAVENMNSNNDITAGKKLYAVLSLFSDKYGITNYNNPENVNDLITPGLTRNMTKPFMTQYVYGAGKKSLATKSVELAYKECNKQIQKADATYTLGQFLDTWLTLSNNNKFTVEIAKDLKTNSWSSSRVSKVTIAKVGNTYKVVDGDATMDEVQRAWDTKKLSVSFRDNLDTGINEFIKGTLGVAITDATNKVLGITREHNKEIAQAGSIVSAIAEIGLTTKIKTIYEARRKAGSVRLTREDRDKIENYAYDLLSVRIGESAGLAGGSLKSQIKREVKPAIDAIIADVEGYTINTFYPGVEGTIGLAGTNGGKLVEDSTSALTPENNHTIDSYIANAVHNRLSDINLRDVFDALITGADTFNDAMKVANQAHMGTMYTYNSKHYIACSLRNAINIFNTEIKSDIEKVGGAYKDIIDKQVKQTFADYGLNGVTLAHPETDLVRYANQLELTAVQDDLNRINQLQSILNGNLNNLKENGYFGTVESTFDITNQNNRDTIVRMIQFLCDRNGLEYDPATGHYTNLPALTDANAISSLTTYNADIFNYMLANNYNPQYKVVLDALCNSTRNNNENFTLKSEIFNLHVLSRNTSIEDLIKVVENNTNIISNKAQIRDTIIDAARHVLARNHEFRGKALETLDNMNHLIDTARQRSINFASGQVDEALQSRLLFEDTTKAFNEWDSNTQKTRNDLYSALTGLLQEQFELGQIIGPDLKKFVDAAYEKLLGNGQDINSITKADILLAIDDVQTYGNVLDAYKHEKKIFLEAADVANLEINTDSTESIYEILNKAQTGNHVYIHKDTDLSWESIRNEGIIHSANRSTTGNNTYESPQVFIQNFIDANLEKRYKNVTDSDIIYVEGHNTTDLLAYARLKYLQCHNRIAKKAKIIYSKDLRADHSKTGSLRTQDAIVANLLKKQANKPETNVVVFSFLGDTVDTDLIDSIAFWGNPELVNDKNHRQNESFAVPDTDLRGRSLSSLIYSDANKAGANYTLGELRKTVRNRNLIKSGDLVQIDTRYNRDMISSNKNYAIDNVRVDLARIAQMLSSQFYNEMDPNSASEDFVNLVNTSAKNITPSVWLHSTVNSQILTNAGLTKETAKILTSGLRVNSSSVGGKAVNILTGFKEFNETVRKGDVVGIPITIGSDGNVYLPQGNNYTFQLINALGGKKVLNSIKEQYNQRQNTDSESDPVYVFPVTFKNTITSDIVHTQVQFINLNNNLISKQQLQQYIITTAEQKKVWDYNRLMNDYKITGKLPSADLIDKGLGSVTGAGAKNANNVPNGFYRIPLLPKDFDLNKAINTNTLSTTDALSYIDYMKAHIAKVSDTTGFTGTYHLLGETLDLCKDNSDAFIQTIQQYTVDGLSGTEIGSITKEKAKEYNKLPIGQSDSAERIVSQAMETGNQLSGISTYTPRHSRYNVLHANATSTDLDKYLDSARYADAEQSAEQYTNTIRQWIQEDTKFLDKNDNIDYLYELADMLGQSQLKMHIRLIDAGDAASGVSGIDMNNIDNHMDAAVVVSTRRDMAKRPALSKAEILVHEIAHNHFRLMSPHQYMEATRLWSVASKILTPEALERAGASHEEAKEIYDYVFRNNNSREDAVHEFLAYALTNRYMIRALNDTAANNKLALALRSRTIGLGRKAIDYITGKHGNKNEPNVAVNEVKNLFKKCIMMTHDWDTVKKNIYRYNSSEKLHNEYASELNKEASNFKQGLFHKLDTQLKALPDWDDAMGRVFDSISGLKDDFAKSIIKELEGTSNNSLIYAKCAYKYRSQLDSAKGVSIGTMKDTINELLKSYGIRPSETKLRKNLSEVIMRLDLGSLNKGYDADQIINFLKTDNKERTNEIDKLKAAINNPWMLNKANELADYLITGTSKSGVRYTNAYQIASMYGTNKPNNVAINSDLYKNIDMYVTLKAIDNMIHSNLKDNPITDSENGVLTVLNRESSIDENKQKGDALLKHLMAIQEGLKHNEISKVWGNSEDAVRNMPKGYIFPNTQSDSRVRLVAVQDLERWKAIGYAGISNPLNIDGHQMVWIGTKHHAFSPDVSGLFSKAAKNFIHGKNNQLNVYGDDFMYGQLSENDQAQMFAKVLNQVTSNNGTFSPLAGTETNLVPRFDKSGNITAFDVEMNNQAKETYLTTDLDISTSMANTAGMITERAITPDTNKATVRALLDYYKNNKNNKKWTWVNENHEMWKFLPDCVKQEVSNNKDLKDKGFPIETKYLDRVFGKEKFSLANWSEKKLIQGFAEESFLDNIGFILANNSLVQKAEWLAKKATEWGKSLVVVKGMTVSLNNIASNIGTLCGCEGMTVKQTIKYMTDGFQCIQMYVDALRKKSELETQLALWNGTEPNKRKPGEDLRLQAAITQMQRVIDNNPASELIKAGLFNASPLFTASFHKPVAVQLAEKFGGKVMHNFMDNPIVSNLTNLQGSKMYKLSISLATFNDFAARYALYKHMQDKAQKDGKNFNMDDFIKRGDELFVNYNTSQGSLIEYLDDMGIESFTKYLFGVQKGIYNSFKDHPVSMLAKTWLASILGVPMPSILDSMFSFDSVMNRFKLPGQMLTDNIGSLPSEVVLSSLG